ncbi:hypothetical protein [Mesorhizobium sp.]
MAEAVRKLTSRPGVCMVARGAGATNAAAGCMSPCRFRLR